MDATKFLSEDLKILFFFFKKATRSLHERMAFFSFLFFLFEVLKGGTLSLFRQTTRHEISFYPGSIESALVETHNGIIHVVRPFVTRVPITGERGIISGTLPPS